MGVLTERIDNPHLAEMDSSSDSSRFRVSRNELDILDTTSLTLLVQRKKGQDESETYVRNGDGVENLLGVQIPQTKRVCMSDLRDGLQDSDRLDKVRGQNELLLPVNTQSMGRVLLSQNVQSALYILRPLVNDVEVGISLDQTTRRGTQGRAHVGNVEASIRFSADLVRNRGEKSTVALLELGTIGVRGVEVIRSVLLKCKISINEEGEKYTYLSL